MSMSAASSGMVERPLRRFHAELGHHRELGIIAQRDARRHPLGVEDAVKHQHMAFLDAGGVEDEVRIGFLQQRLARRSRTAFSVSTQALKLATSSSLVIGLRGSRPRCRKWPRDTFLYSCPKSALPAARCDPPDVAPRRFNVRLAVLQRRRQMPTHAGAAWRRTRDARQRYQAQIFVEVSGLFQQAPSSRLRTYWPGSDTLPLP